MRDYVEQDIQIRLAKSMAWATTLIAVVLGSVGVLNTMIMAVFERTREIGVLRAIAPTAARVTDKMPFNFLWAGLIHLAFPRALIIHCRRSPIDTALSIHQTYFHPSMAFPTGGDELVAYFRSYQRLMSHWRTVLPVDRFIEVDYEYITSAPEPVIRLIIAACGLAWQDACLRPECNQRAVKTQSRWQTRQPIYRTSVARWHRYEQWLGPLRALVDGR